MTTHRTTDAFCPRCEDVHAGAPPKCPRCGCCELRILPALPGAIVSLGAAMRREIPAA